jgi:hypothetical protein
MASAMNASSPSNFTACIIQDSHFSDEPKKHWCAFSEWDGEVTRLDQVRPKLLHLRNAVDQHRTTRLAASRFFKLRFISAVSVILDL